MTLKILEKAAWLLHAFFPPCCSKEQPTAVLLIDQLPFHEAPVSLGFELPGTGELLDED